MLFTIKNHCNETFGKYLEEYIRIIKKLVKKFLMIYPFTISGWTK